MTGNNARPGSRRGSATTLWWSYAAGCTVSYRLATWLAGSPGPGFSCRGRRFGERGGVTDMSYTRFGF
jgi:hypothetical protein